IHTNPNLKLVSRIALKKEKENKLRESREKM
ncbi:unnamed protein product, partial [marine sediment metagenome]